MRTPQLLPLLLGFALAVGSFGELEAADSSCVVDVGAALAEATKTFDTTPLAEGTWANDVYVMPYSHPNPYDRELPDGMVNIEARQWVTQSFYAHNPDVYDFIVVVTDFPFDAGWGQHGDPTHGLYWEIKNDTAGIGLGFFDNSQVFGSNRLQGFIDANTLELVRDPDGGFDHQRFQTVLSHELGHRWLAHSRFENDQGVVSDDLQGVDFGHWSYLLDSDASFMYGADWRGNGDGSYTAIEVKARFSDLDLYLMGLLEADDVELITLLTNPAIPADQYPETGAVIAATPTEISPDQIIAAEGPRIPSARNAQHEHRIALVYLVSQDGQADSQELGFLSEARNQWQRSYFAMTEGRGIIEVGRNSLPIVSPTTLDLDAAVSWLLDSAGSSGQWADDPATLGRDTAAVVTALDTYGGYQSQVGEALDALAGMSNDPTEVAAWRAAELGRHGHPGASNLLDDLVSWVLEEGAWGGGLRYAGDTATTSRIARALNAGGHTAAAGDAIAWLKTRQNADGSWPWRDGGAGAATPTLEAVSALLAVDPTSWAQPTAQDALTWLLARRSQGGFGDSHPNVQQTAVFLQMVHGHSLDQAIINQAIDFLAAHQRFDGSWGGSVYQTAMAVAALAPFVQPDLSVNPAELLIEPERPFTDDPLTLTAAVRAHLSDIPAGVAYRWEALNTGGVVVATLDGIMPPIPASLFATVTDTWDLRYQVTEGTFTFRFTVDPENEVAEADETNNIAEVPVTFRSHPGWIDLELRPDEVHASPTIIGSVPQAVVIDGLVRNSGVVSANNAVLSVFEAGSPAPLASTVVSVPLTGEAAFQLVVQLDEARPYRLAVVADPDDLLNDDDPSNNRIELDIGLAATFDPAVETGSLAVNPPTSVTAGDLVTISFDLANHGTEPVSSVQVGVAYATGEPPVTNILSLWETSEPLSPGEMRSVAMDWRPPTADPALTITVEADPHHLIDDADRGNNNSEIVIAVAPSPLPNLVASHTAMTFEPTPALQHETVHITAMVINPTDNSTGAFVARLWIDAVGTLLIGEVTIPGLGAGGSATVEADWLVDEMADRTVWLEVDSEDQVTEFDEGDNEDFKVLDVDTIPDLVLTSGQVTFEPRFPHTGEVVAFEITVLNTGDQPAADVSVELAMVDGGTIATASIPLISGGGSESVVMTWTTDGLVGSQVLRVTADPSDTVVELSEDNNTAELHLVIQDADLWMTERYISPNGDGVSDSTTVFVRDGVETIEIVDPWGELVRELPLDSPGSAVWDGRSTDGAVVRDGVYTLRADGLTSWVDVDLNQTTITDDIREPLVTGFISPTSSHPSARFTSFTPSPVDGIVYLIEWLGNAALGHKIWRWNGERLEEVLDWPEDHWNLRNVSADGQVFVTGSNDFYLVRFPGPQIDALTPPVPGHRPHLSPDGRWILWMSSAGSSLVTLQRTGDLSEVHHFGPYSAAGTPTDSFENTLDFSADGSRAVVGMHNPGYGLTAGHGLALEISLDDSPEIREIALDQGCGSIQDYGFLYYVFASVDFDANTMTCVRDSKNELYTIDLRTGSTIESAGLPSHFDHEDTWYRLSNDGRVVEVDEWMIELKRSTTSPHFLFDWRRGHTAPWHHAPYGNGQPVWSSHDRYSYGVTNDRFRYQTPAANLTAILNPVVRFGNAGIDLFLTVTDRNLDHWFLEAAPASNPDAFEPIGQPSRDTIFGANRGTWIPPAPGTWKIRLTAIDLAGNERSTTRWVTWNGVSDIAGLWTESRHVSPVSSPGVQDELVWQYTVLRPSQLLFEIVNESGELIHTIPVGADQTGFRTTSWNGLDDSGRPVPDGLYALTFRGAEWPVIVDNTPPVASFEISANGLRPTSDEIDTAAGSDPPIELKRSALFNRTTWSTTDSNLDRTLFETRDSDQTVWNPVGETLFSETSEPSEREGDIRSEWWNERVLRLVATDLAGNRSVAERLHREEALAFAIGEPPCRNEEIPCIYPDRPEINAVRDADGLISNPVAVLWPDYSTLLVQSTVWGEWRDSLRLEFRVPGEGGLPPGDWQPGTLTVAANDVWRRVKAFTDDPLRTFRTLNAQILPVYWEHQGLPLRPYEVRLSVDNIDGDEITSPSMLLSPKTPLVVEYLSTDAGGDHFRVHNVSTVRIDGIALQNSANAVHWTRGIDIGSLDPGLSTLANVGCAFHQAAIDGHVAAWVRVEGIDPTGATQHSLPAAFQRAGPPQAFSIPSFSMVRSGCSSGAPAPQGMIGYTSGQNGPVECTDWRCDLGWSTAGSLVDLSVAVPAVDPNGTAVAGYELLVDGAVVAGAPELTPGTSGRVILDLSALPEGDHTVSERYLFGPGEQGILSSCVQTTTLHVDRSVSLSITSPTEDEILCPDQGPAPIEWEDDGDVWRTTFSIDGSNQGVFFNPVTREASISVPALDPGSHTLETEVVDLAGNAACASVDFFSEGVAVPNDLAADPSVFSRSNPSGRPTESIISFGTTAPADYIVEILDTDGFPITAADGFVDAGEIVSLLWDGTDGDNPVPDGEYEYRVRLESSCGAVYDTPLPRPVITLDTEAPILVVTSPYPDSPIRTAIEFRALINDPYFERWEARIRALTPEPGDWFVFASGIRPSFDPEGVLARWSITHLAPGDYEVEVEAVDQPGNRSVVSIPLQIEAPELIASFDASPAYISPNGDNLADAVSFDFVLLHEAEVYLGFEGWIDLIDYEPRQPGIIHTASWDGLDPDSNPVPDGPYSFVIDASNSPLELWESDSATVIVDRDAPVVTITSPSDGGLTALPVRVSGFSADLHADSYNVFIEHPGGATTVVAEGVGAWQSNQAITIEDLPDGLYRVSATATDLAENTTTVEHVFTIDNTAPTALITAPPAGEILDPTTSPFLLEGVITASHPQSVSWWIGPGAAPDPGDFVLLAETTPTAAGEVSFEWTGPSPPDGVHTIRLTTTDQLGRIAEDRRVLAVDSTPPLVEISSPLTGALVTAPLSITGLVEDENISHWTLEEITAGSTVRLLAAGATPVSAALITWVPLPDDGLVTLRLSAEDHAGHIAETEVNVEVSVLPPGPPEGLTAEIVNGRNILLNWSPGPGSAPVGYHVERNGTRITTVPLTLPTFTDPQLLDGVYSHRVIAVGPHGRESEPSETVTVVVNVTPPNVVITSPPEGGREGSEVSVYGTAFATDDFAFWELSARAAGAPDWIILEGATAPVMGGLLTTWNTHLPPWFDGPHELRLAAEDVVGNRAEHVVGVTIDNTAPDPGPANLQALLTALDPDGLMNDVQLSWVQTPSPPDLAGFYLYRDGLLANAPGPVVGDPTPFLLQGLSYEDRDVPDGSWTYTVSAADTAGNVSALSAPAGPILIDTRRPHALITAPADGIEVESSVEVVAECADEDVVSLELQYRLSPQPEWTPITPTFSAPPYTAVFTPPGHGTYLIRAVAADSGGSDPDPHVISITAADLPPAAPLQPTSRVSGGDVHLTWVSPPDPAEDLAGFEVERDGMTITAVLLPPETIAHLDSDLPDGDYVYRIIAVDSADQRTASDHVSAQVRTPFWDWIAPVASRNKADLSGGGAHSEGAAEIAIDNSATGVTTILDIDADADGDFEAQNAPLGPSIDTVIAASVDDDGNTSRSSLPLVLVSRPPPETVQNLTADVSGSDVTLDWTSTETEGAGFRIFRSGAVINESVTPWTYQPTTHAVNATGADPSAGVLVLDGDPITGWAPEAVPSRGRPEWWSWTWPEPIEIAEIATTWSSTDPPQSWDVDVLTPAGWLWLASLVWDGQPTTDLSPGVTATGVRLRIPETGFCGTAACLPVLAEVSIQRAERTTDTSFVDLTVSDGVHTFEVQGLTIWGRWSDSASVAIVVGPDQPVPPSEVTVSTVDCSGLEVAWQPAATQPGVPFGFKIFRSDTPGGPFEFFSQRPTGTSSVTDSQAPVGVERHYTVASLVEIDGVVVESAFSPSGSGTASCQDPPPPVITYPTTAGSPIVVTPTQVPIQVRGNAVSGSTVTLLHEGAAVATQTASLVFAFDDIDLHPGINTFTVRQELLGSSVDSAPIDVELDENTVPDIESVSLTASPAAATPNDLVMLEGTIALNGASGIAEAFDVVIELTDASGNVSDVHQTRLLMATGEFNTVRAAWTASGPAGPISWRLIVDPADEVLELDENNNTVVAQSHLLDGSDVELAVNLDRSSYVVGQHLTGTTFFASPGPPEDILLETLLEDSTGRLVAVIDSRGIVGFGGDWVEINFDHSLAGNYPGLYRVRAVALADGAVIAEDWSSFELRQSVFLTAEVSTNRSSYPEGTSVAVLGRIRNLGSTTIHGLSATLEIVDGLTGTTVAATEVPDIGVVAGGDAEVPWNWSTSGAPLGHYRATLTVEDASVGVLAVAEPFAFVIVPGEIRLSAEIELSASPVEPGDAVTAAVTLANSGSVDLPGTAVTITVVDPVVSEITEQHTHSLDLAAGSVVALDQILSTGTLKLRQHVVLVAASGVDDRGPFNVDLASAVLEVADLSPPDVSVVEPSGGLACDEVVIEAVVTDTLSRVSGVFHLLDDDPTAVPMHRLDPAVDPHRWGSTRPLPVGEDDSHFVTVFAEDEVGNLSIGESVAFDADTVPPSLLVSGPEDGSCTAGPVSFSFTVIEEHPAGLTTLLDGTPYTEGSPIAAEGSHLLDATITDVCGRAAHEVRSFIIDATNPEVLVTGVSQGAQVLLGTILEWWADDPNLVAAAATLDGIPIGTTVTLSTPGDHTLHVTATDCAGNAAELVVTFSVTEAVLALTGGVVADPSVIEPGMSVVLTGEAANAGTDLSSVLLILDVVDGTTGTIVATYTETANLSSGDVRTVSFSPDSSGWELGPHEVRLTARGLFIGDPFELPLGTATVSVADLTPPNLVLIEPAPGLACDAVIVTAGVTDDLSGVAAVAVAVNGGGPIPLVPSGGTTWSAPLDLDDGLHSLEVTAIDSWDNTSAPAIVSIDLDTEEPVLHLTAPDEGACIPEGVVIEFSADDDHLDEVSASLDDIPIPSGHGVDPDGDHSLEVTATDVCGRQSVETRSFTIDTVDPEIALSGVFDAGVFAVGVPGEWSASDDNITSAEATLDGESIDEFFQVSGAGDHVLQVAAEDCAGNTADMTVEFETVFPDNGLGGTVNASPAQIEPPDPLQIAASAVSLMDTDLTGLVLRLEIFDPFSGAVAASHETTVDLPGRTSTDLEHPFDTDSLGLGIHGLRLKAEGTIYGQGFDVELAGTAFEVVDLTPPSVTISSPDPGLVCGVVEIGVVAVDTVAGVETVRVYVDGDPTGLPLAHVANDTWILELALDEGAHHLEVVANDSAGNSAEPVAVEIGVDLTPPTLYVSAPADGECRSQEATIVFSAEDEHLEVVEARLNGTAIPSGAVIASDNSYALAVEAVDACGRTDSFGTSFIIDATSPVINVSGIVDGADPAPPVDIDWSIHEINLTGSHATLDDLPVVPPLTVVEPGEHTLNINAEDCAGNHGHVTVDFTVTDDPTAGVEVHEPAIGAGGSTLLLDRSPSDSFELEAWLGQRSSHVVRVTDGCDFINELRRARHELVVLHAPTGSLPLSFASCPNTTELEDLATELSATTYRHGGVLILGGGLTGDDCLGCRLPATSSVLDSGIVERLEVSSATSILDPGDGTPIFDLRPVEPAGSFPLLLGNGGGAAVCDGARTVTMEFDTELAGPWEIEASAATPISPLDSESGQLDDGGSVNAGSHPWVDLAVGRTGETLSLELSTTRGGALPDWVRVDATAAFDAWVTRSSAWIPITCGLTPGQVFDRFSITGIEIVEHDLEHTVAATARRWGRGEALILPWDPLSPANSEAQPAVDQAIDFLLRARPWPAVAGLAVPVTFEVANSGTDEVTVRIEATIPFSLLDEVWDDPVELDPVRWEVVIDPGSSISRTVWIRPAGEEPTSIPFVVSAHHDGEWITVDSGVVDVDVVAVDSTEMIRRLRLAIDECSQSIDDDDARAILRDVAAAVDRFALAATGPDRTAEALRELVIAFAAIEAEPLPCFAELRVRLADQLVLWQARWVIFGSTP